MTYAEYARALSQQARAAPTAEWRIVMQYYAALHATNSVLYEEGRAPLTHTIHEARLFADATLATFDLEYLELKALSLQARYHPTSHPMTQADVELADRFVAVLMAACGL